MKIDKKTVDLLLSLDDDRLWATVSALGGRLGVTLTRPDDMAKLRVALSALSETDLDRVEAIVRAYKKG